jgi:L-malate glycosyltransferase
MKILVAVTNLSIGGAQTLILRLIEDLVENHDVYLYDFNLFASGKESSVVQRLSKSVHLISAEKYTWVIGRAISLDFRLAKLGWRTNFTEKLRCYLFRHTVSRHQIDIVNSHLFHSDYFVSKSLSSTSIPIVMVDHGDYRFILEEDIADLSQIAQIFQQVKAIVYISDSNLSVLKNFLTETKAITRKIYNGFSKPKLQGSKQAVRKSLGIKDDAIVFCMVARGIPEKGWTETIQAFREVVTQNPKETHLIFVGWSDYLQTLRDTLTDQETSYIHFTGYADQPENWIQASDICLLPTYFSGESLPCSIIEYLAQGKPVIATDIGGIAEMLQHNENMAGKLLPLKEDQKPDPKDITKAMLDYINQPDLLQSHSDIAQAAFDKFQMNLCSESYQKLFEEIIQAENPIYKPIEQDRIQYGQCSDYP